MEQRNDIALLDLMARPAFCVCGGSITRVNAGAAAFDIAPGMAVSGLLRTGSEEYAAFEGGCLYLTLSAAGRELGASVTRMEDFDVFCLEESADSRELQAMALAAKELRSPLDNIMTTAQQLFPVAGLQDDPATREQVARINRGLYQMLRVIGNMSDAEHYAASPTRQSTVEITALLAEIFEKASGLVSRVGMELTYQGHPETIYCLADAESLERAVLNMVSNAVKFAPGGHIRASLTRRGRMLYLTVADDGEGIPAQLRGDVFTRYQRQCGHEDRRFGIGLGLVLIRAAAAAHGGAVLMEQPKDGGTRITMSLAIRQGGTTLRNNILQVDYAGERDHGLIELSGFLPTELYEKEI